MAVPARTKVHPAVAERTAVLQIRRPNITVDDKHPASPKIYYTTIIPRVLV